MSDFSNEPKVTDVRKPLHRFTADDCRNGGRKSGTKAAEIPGRMQALGRAGGLKISAVPGHMSKISKLRFA